MRSAHPRPGPAASPSAFLNRVENPYAAEQRGRAAVAHRRDLTRLTLAAVESAAEQIGLRTADRFHRSPEVGRRRLVGDVAKLPDEPAVANLVEPLASELEVVTLHVDRPALVTDDVDAATDAADQLIGGRPVRRGLQ